ncbi:MULTISPECIES: hypothetical protein [unclassified Corynebacterium]|uniref:hypothetical protein n=1 Tax=unclassified Corynebacterium TaxID=2624378 RepID=UPI003098F9AB
MQICDIACLVEALPDSPNFTFETPFPALESFAGEDLNISSTVGDINMPFGQDAFDISVTDSHDVAVSDILDVTAGNGVAAE